MKKYINILKKTITYIFFFLVIFFILNVVVGSVVYESLFNRYEIPDYDITPGLVSYEEVKNDYPREEIDYFSNNVRLKGYYYHQNDSDKLVVFSHGINDGGDSLLVLHMYFLDKGYNVFSFDNSGCFKSDGKAKGFTEAFVDLDHTLSFMENDNRFKDYKKLLVGFSCGAFAVSAIGNLNHKNIIGTIAICGFNDSKTIIQQKGIEYTGALAYFGIPVLNEIERSKFGSYLDYTAVSGINKSNVPTLIAQAKMDKVVRFDVDSIICKKDEITNPNVLYYVGEDNEHNDILYSYEAIKYQHEVKANLRSFDYKNKVMYNKYVDDELYSELNKEFTKKIDALCELI